MSPGARFIAAIPNGWRAGMLADCGSGGRVRITDVLLFAGNYLTSYGYGWTNPVPDLNDPATLGAAVSVLRDVSGCPALQLSPSVSWGPPDADGKRPTRIHRWIVYLNDEDERRYEGPTEPEAIAAAAEALKRTA